MDTSNQYKDVIYYLQNLKSLLELIDSQKRSLKLQAIRYVIVQGQLWWRSMEGVLLKCVDEIESKMILKDMHEGVCGGHYMAKTTTHKILKVGFWQPTLFRDAHEFVKVCDAFKRFSGKLIFFGNLPLRPIEVQTPFQQWKINFICEISNKSSGGHSQILVATNYFTKWVEAIPTKNATSKVMINFILNNIMTKFGCPQKIVTNNAMCFGSKEYNFFCKKYGIIEYTSSPYHPQGNGQEESSNKSIFKIIKRILGENKKAWDSKLPLAL